MLFLEQGTKHPFIEIFRDSTTRLPLAMTGVTISIVHYDDSATPVEVVDVAETSMTSLGSGKYVHFQTISSSVFSLNTIYYVRIKGTHPIDGTEELTEQQFMAAFPGSVGRLTREQITEGDTRAFVVDFRDFGTRQPLDMVNVTIEIAYYTDAATPEEQFALAQTPMASLGNGRYAYLLEVDSSFPINTEFFVRYRGIHPDDGTEELVQEEFSSFETPSLASGVDTYPVDPF